MIIRKINSKRIEIAGKKLKLIPMNARQGLEAVLTMSKYVNDASSYIPVLGDRSKKIRALALVKMLTEVQGFDQFILDMVALGTGVSKSEIEDNATFVELIKAFNVIWELNEWNKFWEVAYSVRLVEEKNWLSWAFSEARRLRKV